MGCIFGKSKNRKMVQFDRRRRVSVRIGSQVRRLNSRPVTIFIFGGPGSRKGAIIENIVSCFGFQHISIGNIIQAELLRHRPSTVKKFENVRETKAMIELHEDRYTMQWLTEVLSKRMQEDLNAVYLIDLIPNLKFVMKAKYLTEECRPALAAFNSKYPISFALNLAVPSDRLLQVKDAYLSSASGTSGGMQETGGRGDEADTTKLQKRAGLYEDISKYFIAYFTGNDTLVTVDVTGGLTSDIWQRVHQLLCELNFRPIRTVGTVLVFEFDEADSTNIDMDKYAMEMIYLENVVRNPQDSVENLLKSLSRFIDSNSSRADAFVVRAEGTSLTKEDLLAEQPSPVRLNYQPLMFTDIGVNYLENYLPGKPKNYVPCLGDRQYKSISSSENEIYLFPVNTPDAVCRQIAYLMVQNRSYSTAGAVVHNVESFTGQTRPVDTDLKSMTSKSMPPTASDKAEATDAT